MNKMAFFITKKRRAKHIQLLLDKERLEQRIKEVNNKNNFFRKENAELRNKLKIAGQLLEERDSKLKILNSAILKEKK